MSKIQEIVVQKRLQDGYTLFGETCSLVNGLSAPVLVKGKHTLVINSLGYDEHTHGTTEQRREMQINKIYNENCLDTMSRMPDSFIDLTVTSPPYDNLRYYKGYSFDFEPIASELFRVTKQGGVVVWVVNDATVNGSETGTSFKQALYFKKIGFNLHDTMIWNKPNAMPNVDKSRYCQSFEYMFVFSKGKPRTTNLRTIPTKNAGKVIKRKTLQTQNCNKANRVDKTNPTRIDFNVYTLNVGGKKEAEHPAIFPEQLANDHIISWSNDGDLIYDPFMGSGTTAKMAILNNRNWIGSEMASEYCEIIQKRIRNIKEINVINTSK